MIGYLSVWMKHHTLLTTSYSVLCCLWKKRRNELLKEINEYLHLAWSAYVWFLTVQQLFHLLSCLRTSFVVWELWVVIVRQRVKILSTTYWRSEGNAQHRLFDQGAIVLLIQTDSITLILIVVVFYRCCMEWISWQVIEMLKWTTSRSLS